MQDFTHERDDKRDEHDQDGLFEALKFFGITRKDPLMQTLERIVEPELMDEKEQAKAYSEADFTVPHDNFVHVFEEKFPGVTLHGEVLDLGCGPADVMVRFAKRFSECRVTGVDGAAAMLELAVERVEAEGLSDRLSVVQGLIPGAAVPDQEYEAIISSSLLHHLHHPEGFWEEIHRHATPGTKIYVMDLMRPRTLEQAEEFKKLYVANEPEVLQEDFFNSLLAAFTLEEVRLQLRIANLGHLQVEAISDRHFVVHGTY